VRIVGKACGGRRVEKYYQVGGCFREGILDFIFLFNSGALAGAGEFVGAST
jgi:hypothetical protein